MRDALAVGWKEWREMFVSPSGRRGGFLRVAFLLTFVSVVWPLEAGDEFIASATGPLIGIYFAALFVLGIIPDAIAGERERHTLESLLATRISDEAILIGKLATAVVTAWLLAMLSVVISVIVVNLRSRAGHFLMFSAPVSVGIIVVSFLGCMLLACIAVLVSVRAVTVKQAQQRLSLGMMVLIFAPMTVLHLMSRGAGEWFSLHVFSRGPWRIVGALVTVLFVIDALLFLITRARFRRERLVLD